MERTIKCVLVGDHAAHKPELLIRYTTNKYPSGYVPTRFGDWAKRVMDNGEPYTLALIDTIGQEDYVQLRPLTYPRTDIFLVVFSVRDPSSLEIALKTYIPEVTHHCPKTPFLLVGTRTDLRSTTADHDDFLGTRASCLPSDFGPIIANRIGAVMYKECSALTGEGVKDVIDHAMLAALCPKNEVSQTKISGCGFPVAVDEAWRRAIDSTMTLFNILESHVKQAILEDAISVSDMVFLRSLLQRGSVNELLTAKNQKRLATVASSKKNSDFIRLLFSNGFEVPIQEWGKRYQHPKVLKGSLDLLHPTENSFCGNLSNDQGRIRSNGRL